MDIKIVRLTTGEELVAKVQEFENYISIKDIVRIVILPGRTQADAPQVAMSPWGQFVPKDTWIKISKDHVVYLEFPIPEVLAQHKQIFSPIMTPTDNLILPSQWKK